MTGFPAISATLWSHQGYVGHPYNYEINTTIKPMKYLHNFVVYCLAWLYSSSLWIHIIYFLFTHICQSLREVSMKDMIRIDWYHRDHSWYGLSQWETPLHCNGVSHWINLHISNVVLYLPQIRPQHHEDFGRIFVAICSILCWFFWINSNLSSVKHLETHSSRLLTKIYFLDFLYFASGICKMFSC